MMGQLEINKLEEKTEKKNGYALIWCTSGTFTKRHSKTKEPPPSERMRRNFKQRPSAYEAVLSTGRNIRPHGWTILISYN